MTHFDDSVWLPDHFAPPFAEELFSNTARLLAIVSLSLREPPSDEQELSRENDGIAAAKI